MKNCWQTRTLGEICAVDWGNTNLTKSAYVEGGKFLAVSAAGCDGRIGQKEHEKYTPVLSAIGAQCGRMFFPEEDFTAIKNTITLTPRDGTCTGKFLYQLLTYVELPKRGAAQPFISKGDIQSFKVPVPPLAEQQRIVGLLDEAFEGLATTKANAEKNLQNARDLFESHLQSVFTQRGPGWVETTLGEVIEIVGGSQPPKSVFSKTKKPDNIRLIQIRDYKSDKHVVFIPRAQAKRFCNADDVMIGRYGPPLFQILRGIEGAYNVALMKAVPDEAKLSRDFLFYFLKHSAILQYVIYHSSRAAGQIGVTKETLEPYPIALPSLTVQKTVVEK